MIYIHNVNLAANLLVHVSLVIALDADSGLNMQGSFSEGNEVHTEFFSVVNVSTTPNTLNSFTPIGHLNLSNSSPDGFSTMNLSNSSTDGFSTTVHSVDTASSVNSSSTTSGSAFTSTADWVKSTAQVQSVDNSSFELDGTSEIDSNMETTQSVISYPPQTTQFTEQKRDVKVTTVNNPEALTTRSCCSTSIAAIQEADHSLVQTVMTSTPANESQQKSNRSDTNNTDHIITSTSSWRLLNTTAAVLNPLSSTTSDLQFLQETTSSEVLTNSTNAASNTASNRVGSAAAIGLGVIFSLIGLAAILILLVLLRRRFGLCQSLSYRKHADERGQLVTYTYIENGNYIGPPSPLPASATSRRAYASNQDEMTLLPHGSDGGHDDVSLEERTTTTFKPEDVQQSSAQVHESADELDQPVLLDIDANLIGRRGGNYEPIASGDDSATGDGTNSDHHYLRPSCHEHRDASNPEYRPFHEYDPVYVPRHDAESMARRIDESSYVRTPRARRCVDPYEEVRSDGQGLGQRQRGLQNQRQQQQPAVSALPEDIGPAPVAPPRIASAGRVAAAAGRERRAPPPIVGDAGVAMQAAGVDNEPPQMNGGGVEMIDSPYEAVDISRSVAR